MIQNLGQYFCIIYVTNIWKGIFIYKISRWFVLFGICKKGERGFITIFQMPSIYKHHHDDQNNKSQLPRWYDQY